jgi:hypothetical protein
VTYFNVLIVALVILTAVAIAAAISSAWVTVNRTMPISGDLVVYLPTGERVTLKHYRGKADLPLLNDILKKIDHDRHDKAAKFGSPEKKLVRMSTVALLPIGAATAVITIILGLQSNHAISAATPLLAVIALSFIGLSRYQKRDKTVPDSKDWRRPEK